MQRYQTEVKLCDAKYPIICSSYLHTSVHVYFAIFSVGVLVPGSIDGLNMQGTDTFKTGGNRYETFSRGPVGARDDNALNEHAYTLQKQAQVTSRMHKSVCADCET